MTTKCFATALTEQETVTTKYFLLQPNRAGDQCFWSESKDENMNAEETVDTNCECYTN